MSSLLSKFDHNHNSSSVFPRVCRIPSPSIHISLADPRIRQYQSGGENSSWDGESLLGDQDDNDRHAECDQIFGNLVYSEEARDGQNPKRKHNLPELIIDEDVDRLTCAFEMEFTAATPLSASGRLSCPPWPLEALGIRGESCDREDLDHLSCDATDCGYGSCNPPTPGERVFTPIPEDAMSSIVLDPASASLMSMSTHFGSPISTLELDSPTLGWTPGSSDFGKSSSHMALDPIFTHFNIGGLPSPDDTPTEDDCLTSLFPLFEARYESSDRKPITPLAKRLRTDSCITDAPKKRLRKRSDGEADRRKKRKSR